MKPQHFIANKFWTIVLAGMTSFTAIPTFADVVWQIDVTGTFNNVPAGTTAFGHSITTGSTYDFTYYLDYAYVNTNSQTDGFGTTYSDSTHNTTLSLNGGAAITIPGISRFTARRFGAGQIIFDAGIPENAGAGFTYASQYVYDGNINRAINALENFINYHADGSFYLMTIVDGQQADLFSPVSNVVVTVPEPSSLVIGIFGAGMIMFRRRVYICQ